MTCAKSSWYTLNSDCSVRVVCGMCAWVRGCSPVAPLLTSPLFKTGRQASQLLTHFKEIFENGLLPLFLYPYAPSVPGLSEELSRCRAPALTFLRVGRCGGPSVGCAFW
jgi:hypothetical protein